MFSGITEVNASAPFVMATKAITLSNSYKPAGKTAANLKSNYMS